MSQIIIVAPPYHDFIGGSISQHKLCDILNRQGYNAVLYSTPHLMHDGEVYQVCSRYESPLASRIDEEDICIYPEITKGTPFSTKYSVRYILNNYHHPEKDDNIKTWNDDDFWVYFSERFYDGIKPENYWYILDYKWDVHRDLGNERMYESCFTYRKMMPKRNELPKVHPNGSIEVGFKVSDHELRDVFNRCKTFYSYDTETYLSTIAALCGCDSIVVPNPNISKEYFYKKNPAFKYGVSYGTEDLERVRSERHLLRPYLQSLDTEQEKNTTKVLEKIFNHFNLQKTDYIK